MENFIRILSLVLILASAIPLIRHDFWVFRVFEYPRLQKLVLNVVLIATIVTANLPSTLLDKMILGGLIVNCFYLCYLIWPFTRIAKKQIINSTQPAGDNNINLLIANVYQYNRRSADYLKLIQNCDPDVILMVETDNWWEQQLTSIEEKYPYQIKMPLANTYGMLLYSRLELVNGAVHFLVEDDIPSIEVNVKLRSGQLVKLYCLHPQPPVPQENPRSTERDKEILMVGQKAKCSDIPVLVVGDLNDVAWSYTTELFCKTSGLLDPRRGRGFYNSFNAKYFFLRFPLDHIFCSTDFTLTAIERMPHCGSDHFPMCVNLQYAPAAVHVNEQLEADAEDHQLAQEKIAAECD
ncbi:endonuclease/exonuclease/phosphatase family protein [Mucilaginibacter myungsuensis]|uniref:Endonuclease/exonuclease/phosphatase family protein n=1 Tax=Mucilaginibacter myungsuensis TaxID=649104 RepID=A0A929PWD9_9SPHI|nr:endonuclease/exonuclease/phosphatase family protein [Mucilaginibacter myungsuensis]MBE9661971.1 endonuclease/exonuclease/phosphatase family protein [Mucilaginibacter myungsuensis]MDN3599596.1 endonuclease/exonuclease/phosphatase family protein [Mucilaginibacter myungsuensis]